MKCLRSCLTSKWAAVLCLKVPSESSLWGCGYLSGSRSYSSATAVLDDGQQGLRISRRDAESARQLATLHHEQEEVVQFGEAEPGQLEGMAEEAFDGALFVDKLSDSRQSSLTPLFEEEIAKLWRVVCGHAECARLEDALDELGIHITPWHISVILKSLTNLDTAIRVFLWADKHEYYAHTLLTYTCLLEALACANEFDKAWDLLTEIKTAGIKLTDIPFNVLIKAYGEVDKVDEAIRAFTVMVESGVPLTVFSVNTLLNFLLTTKRFDLAVEIFEELLACGELVNGATFNMLVGALSKSGELQNVVKVASGMKLAQGSVNLETWTVLISGLCRYGKFTKALELFSYMKNAGIKPDVRPHRSFVKWLCIAGKMDDAMVHLQYMNDEGCMPDASMHATLMFGFCKAGRCDDGLKFLSELLEHGGKLSPAVFCHLVDGFCRFERMDEACEMLDEMVRLGYLPLVRTYRWLVLELFKFGRAEKAFMYLKEMREKKVVPNDALFKLMTGGLSRASWKIEPEQVCRTKVSEGLSSTSFSRSALSSCSTFPVRVTEILYKMKKATQSMECAFE